MKKNTHFRIAAATALVVAVSLSSSALVLTYTFASETTAAVAGLKPVPVSKSTPKPCSASECGPKGKNYFCSNGTTAGPKECRRSATTGKCGWISMSCPKAAAVPGQKSPSSPVKPPASPVVPAPAPAQPAPSKPANSTPAAPVTPAPQNPAPKQPVSTPPENGNPAPAAPASPAPVAPVTPPVTCPEGSTTWANTLCKTAASYEKCALPIEVAPGCFQCGALCASCGFCKATTGKTPFNCDNNLFCGMAGVCTDTDEKPGNGGADYDVKGTANPGNGQKRTDYCVSDLVISVSNGKVTTEPAWIHEFMCNKYAGQQSNITGKLAEIQTRCLQPYDRCMAMEGACVHNWTMPVSGCSDNEEKNVTSPGQVSIAGIPAFKDSCMAGGPSVEEWSCNGNTLVHEILPCPEGTWCRISEGSCSPGMPVSRRSLGGCGDKICAYEEQESCSSDCPASSYEGDGICALWETRAPDCPAWLYAPPVPRPGF